MEVSEEMAQNVPLLICTSFLLWDYTWLVLPADLGDANPDSLWLGVVQALGPHQGS